jgi:hypothetical protein
MATNIVLTSSSIFFHLLSIFCFVHIPYAYLQSSFYIPLSILLQGWILLIASQGRLKRVGNTFSQTWKVVVCPTKPDLEKRVGLGACLMQSEFYFLNIQQSYHTKEGHFISYYFKFQLQVFKYLQSFILRMSLVLMVNFVLNHRLGTWKELFREIW